LIFFSVPIEQVETAAPPTRAPYSPREATEAGTWSRRVTTQG